MSEVQPDGNNANKAEDVPQLDALTGLPNRAWLFEELGQRILDKPGSFGVLFVDVDGLKHMNDTMGHQAGDALIAETAEILEGDIRTNVGPDREPDQVGRAVFRYAGDEFVVVLSGADTQEAVDAAKSRLQADLLELGSNGGIKASMGGRPHKPGESSGELIHAVDHLMYEEKNERKARKAYEERMALRKQAEGLPIHKLLAYWAGTKLVNKSGMKRLPHRND